MTYCSIYDELGSINAKYYPGIFEQFVIKGKDIYFGYQDRTRCMSLANN
jgi:hypothetical protein